MKLAFLMLAGIAAFGQSADRFEVASIKPNLSGGATARGFYGSTGRMETTNCTLKGMIQWAYELQSYQIAGGPGWVDTDGFDVVAKEEEATQPSLQARRHFEDLVKNLLADRFQLKLREETREVPIYTLVVAKSGPKIVASEKWQGTESSTSTRTHGGKGEFMAEKWSMPLFAHQALSNIVGRPVIDKTGLPDYYDFKLSWNPDETSPDSTGPSIFTALQEQLGLRLESGRGPAPVLVIEHVEKPSAN